MEPPGWKPSAKGRPPASTTCSACWMNKTPGSFRYPATSRSFAGSKQSSASRRASQSPFASWTALLRVLPNPPWAVCGYTPSQFRSAYGLTGPRTGAGTTVAIVDAYAAPTLYADAARYAQLNDAANQLAKKQFSEDVEHPFTNTSLCDASGWFGEQTLDVEAVHATAPGAHILYAGARSCMTPASVACVQGPLIRRVQSLGGTTRFTQRIRDRSGAPTSGGHPIYLGIAYSSRSGTKIKRATDRQPRRRGVESGRAGWDRENPTTRSMT